MTSDDARPAGDETRQNKPDETHPGEKGPPAWEVRHTRGDPIPDEPPDSSSEVAQATRTYEDPDRDDAGSGD